MQKIINYFAVGVMLLCILGAGVSQYRLGRARTELDYYRTKYDEATNEQQLIAFTIDRCAITIRNNEELLSSTANTIGDLRKQLRQIRENYEQMENIIYDYYDSRNLRRLNNMEDKQ